MSEQDAMNDPRDNRLTTDEVRELVDEFNDYRDDEKSNTMWEVSEYLHDMGLPNLAKTAEECASDYQHFHDDEPGSTYEGHFTNLDETAQGVLDYFKWAHNGTMPPDGQLMSTYSRIRDLGPETAAFQGALLEREMIASYEARAAEADEMYRRQIEYMAANPDDYRQNLQHADQTVRQ